MSLPLPPLASIAVAVNRYLPRGASDLNVVLVGTFSARSVASAAVIRAAEEDYRRHCRSTA
jgi:hypothetical protein